MYFEYLKERENVDYVEIPEKGFATYKILDKDHIYCVDIYVRKRYRKEHLATKLGDMVAEVGKEVGCKYMLGSVSPHVNGCNESMKVLLSYGMKLRNSTPDLIWFIKEL